MRCADRIRSLSGCRVARPTSSRSRGKHCEAGVRERFAPSRELVAHGFRVATLARVKRREGAGQSAWRAWLKHTGGDHACSGAIR